MQKSLLSPLFILILIAFFITIISCKGKKEPFPENLKEISDNSQSSDSLATESYYRDLFPDTWVANDALDRKMPSYEEVGPVKNDQHRVVGIFYITWHSQAAAKLPQPYNADVTRILSMDPDARLDGNHKLWYTHTYHWGEPEMGYFLSQDKYVIRKDMSMLSDAGVDVLVMDVTNAVHYWDEWDVIFNTMLDMRAEGNKVPRFCFWAFNGPVITVVQELYEKIYKVNKYKDLWFYWDGKPLLLYNSKPDFDANRSGIEHPNPNYDPASKTDHTHPHYQDPEYSEEFYRDYTKDVKNFFTLRTMWWGYYEWGGKRFIGTEDNWSFGYSMADSMIKAMKPEELVSTHQGKREQAAVTPAQHPVTMTSENMGVGKSWSRKNGEPDLNVYDMPVSAYVPWLGNTVEHPEGYGIYFQERWDDAISANPEFIYINDWNEWIAGKYPPPEGQKSYPFLGRNSNFFFVDQYNAEFNRCVQPMKGGYTDNYYMQMAQNIRRYKGVRPVPVNKGYVKIKIDSKFSDWEKVKNEFRDTRGDTFHRDETGYTGINYTDTSGRNDIITGKVAVDRHCIHFYARTVNELTPHSQDNWMLLLIDADSDPETGWFGYDFLINRNIIDRENTVLMKYDSTIPGSPWIEISRIRQNYAANELELAVPRKLTGLTSNAFSFDFKWSDNPADIIDPISLCTSGDTAPNRRFNYRFVWER